MRNHIEAPNFKSGSKEGRQRDGYLGDFLFGVGISGDTETMLHDVSGFVETHWSNPNISMLLVDFKSFFNIIDRGKM